MDYDDEEPVAEVAPAMHNVSDAELVKLRDEVRRNVELIRTLESAFLTKAGVFLDCGTEADAKARMALVKGPWAGDNCWTTLGFVPGVAVGGYSVTVDSRGYRVQGWLDADGDGNAAVVLGTRDLPATFTTPASVR